eukprot:4220814-Karenia_brevis.AAC.1
MPSKMIIWSQWNCRSGNSSRYTGISDIHSPENWPELCENAGAKRHIVRWALKELRCLTCEA